MPGLSQTMDLGKSVEGEVAPRQAKSLSALRSGTIVAVVQQRLDLDGRPGKPFFRCSAACSEEEGRSCCSW